MTTKQVGKKLVEFCRAGKNLDAVNALYADNIVSVETHDNPGAPAKIEGIDAVRKKNQWWLDNHTVHSAKTIEPFMNGDQFSVMFDYEVTAKAGPMKGQRMKMEEIALYTVKNDKIVHEAFFYDMGGE